MAVPKPEPAITPATASVPEAPQPTPAAAVPNLGAAPGAAAPAGQGGQPPLTPEQQAAQRLKEQRDAERQKAMIAEAAVPNWSGSAGNTVVTGQPGGANPALAQLQAAARGLQGTPGLAQLAQAQGGGDGDDQNKQARKEAFLTKASLQPDTDYLKATVKEQISKFELKTTAVIPAVLISGINSDLPGDISAQVTDDIYDTATGRFLLIPRARRSTATTTAAWPSARSGCLLPGRASSSRTVRR
nr:TrbI/VirB10 family protein [Ralstonia syzygii]